MNVLDEYTLKLLKTFHEENVKFLVVGGYAVNFHGYYRTTGDIHLWIEPSNDNKLKIIEALKIAGVVEENLSELSKLDFTQHLFFSDGEEPAKIEFMTYLSGVSFSDAYKNHIVAEIDGVQVPFINLNDLVVSKMASNRLKDQLDVEELQKIKKLL